MIRTTLVLRTIAIVRTNVIVRTIAIVRTICNNVMVPTMVLANSITAEKVSKLSFHGHIE